MSRISLPRSLVLTNTFELLLTGSDISLDISLKVSGSAITCWPYEERQLVENVIRPCDMRVRLSKDVPRWVSSSPLRFGKCHSTSRAFRRSFKRVHEDLRDKRNKYHSLPVSSAFTQDLLSRFTEYIVMLGKCKYKRVFPYRNLHLNILPNSSQLLETEHCTYKQRTTFLCRTLPQRRRILESDWSQPLDSFSVNAGSKTIPRLMLRAHCSIFL